MLDRLRKWRLSQTEQELQRKALKARRKDIWTLEDMDYADKRAERLYKAIHTNNVTKE